MPSRSASLALVVALLIAGCTASAPTRSGTTGPTTTTVTPSETPSTTTTEPALTPRPVPDRPTNVTREAVGQFAENHEQAYKWNRELTNRTTEISINPVRIEVRNTTGDGYRVHLEVGFSKTVRRDGAEVVGDGFYTVNYLVNATTVLRAEAGGQQRPGPDPRNGTVVAE